MNKNLNLIKETKNVISMNTKKIYSQFVDFVDTNFLKFQNEMIEYDKFYTVSIDMNGLKKEDIVLQAFEGRLMVAISEKIDLQKIESATEKYRKAKTYNQSFHFENPVDTSAVTAHLYKNSLELYLPKLIKPRDIVITEAEGVSPKNQYYDDDWSSYPHSHVS